jgi:hypothetical protein
VSKKSNIDKLKEVIKYLVVQELKKDDELDEASTTATAGIDGTGTGHYDTPRAFASGSQGGHPNPEVVGYKKVNEIANQEISALQNLEKGLDKLRKDYMKIMSIGDKTLKNKQYNDYYDYILNAQKGIGSLTQTLKRKQMLGEGRYHDWRNDESLTPKQKVGKSVREIRDALNELDKTVKMNLKLKTELNMNSTDYWKNTHKALTKISERLVKMANKIGNLK